jgi:predicted ATPase
VIQTLTIERFKSIRSLTIDCSKVNVLIGAPDTGKTNVLETLHLVSRLGWSLGIDSSLRLNPQLGFDPLFYRQFFDSPIRIVFGGAPDVDLTISIRGGPDRTLQVHEKHGAWSLHFGDSAHIPRVDQVRFYSYTQSENWQYAASAQQGTEVIQPPQGSNLIYIARHNSKVYELLKELTSPAWKVRFDQATKTLRLSEVREDEILDYNLDLLSDSIKRFFFYASVVLTSKDAILVFDEPEVYAFPPYPKRLGEMIAGDQSNQFFLTTHNPYFLSALVEKTPSDQLAVFVSDRDEDGATRLTRLKPVQVSEVIEQGASVFFNLDDFVANRSDTDRVAQAEIVDKK